MLANLFPFMNWIKDYNTETLRSDTIAGLTVALVLIPQSMAYAQLAGLPAYYGLYASFLTPLIAALFGSSRQLATGPVAVVSLMTAASLEPLATMGSEGYIAYAILLALMVGGFQFLLGILRLGLVVNFLSHPVINGFTNAAAIIIATSQVSKLAGVSVDKASHHYETLIRVAQGAFNYTHLPTLAMGLLAFAIMIGCKRFIPKIPNVLAAVLITTCLSWAIGFNHDATIPVSSIESSRVQSTIAVFNGTLASAEKLAMQRTGLSKELSAANAMGESLRALNIQHELSTIELRLAGVKDQSHQLRTSLRNMLFSGVEQSDGTMAFYLKNGTPPAMHTDGRTWRLRVSNTQVSSTALTMMGGGAVVGTIPSGLPTIAAPTFDLSAVLHLIPFAVIISLLGFMEAISIAKAMAAKTGQRIDPDQELIGQGLANMIGAFGRSYPVSGSFSRSAVNLQAGAVTGMSSVFASIMVVLTLQFCTPLLYHLPQAVLAAIIMMAVFGLLNVSSFVHAWKIKWYDGAISVISFITTLAYAPHLDKGIMLGVALSLGMFLYKSMRPNVSFLSRSQTPSHRDTTLTGLENCKNISVIQFEGPLFFANASFLEDIVTEKISENDSLKHIVLSAGGINDVDCSGAEALELIIEKVQAKNIEFSICSANKTVLAVLQKAHLLEKIGTDHIYATAEEALRNDCRVTRAAKETTDGPLPAACLRAS
ncbi:SulP family inorganic anion transporter [Halodesulfovibrio sp. MK-HDV]|jgi:sulfate permease, SulP family|uniref:SulP family inorganic anion transporter n=1 Tax=Halodesulfovibrio sp. MK-HDV TaxID=2599925 RepID=UPI0013710402|nr:SulP family inorganic anion transporter [Halodesulfovibrio sp. MK-HDV]KAF1075061.1 putative sulfate transporter [Halodesulfovibrio sp. MK-HDV]